MPIDLPRHLSNALTTLPSGQLRVAFSGGMDSTVLLHALASLPAARTRGLAAIHVDHGLHSDSAAWARRCADFAASLAVPCEIVRVDVQRDGQGLEAAAREARHAAFAAHVLSGAILALAHHRDDQSETVLLKLLRGAGPEGLAGMRALRGFDAGLLWRPLLDVPRAALRAYAQARALAWIDDPSNADARLSRNILRGDVLPRLRAHWPQLDDSLAHAARHARAAADFIDAEAEKALALVQGFDASTLRWQEWLALPEALRDPALRRWLRALELDEPTHLHVAELERQLHSADAERLPCVAFGRTELRRYRDLVYARTAQADPSDNWELAWDGAPLELPAACGTVRLVTAMNADATHAQRESATARTDMPASAHTPAHTREHAPVRAKLRFRRHGETLKPAGSPHTRELRDLFQQAGVPPWERPRIPLLCDEHGKLLAVGDLWISEAGAAWFARHGLRFEWLVPLSPLAGRGLG